MMKDISVILDPLSYRRWVAFPGGQMIPADAISNYIRETWQRATDEELVAAAKLLRTINQQSEQVVRTERTNQEEGKE